MNIQKHGQSWPHRTPTYVAWLQMKARCNNPKTNNFHLWGGRGLKVHPLWEKDYLAFLGYMGEKPGKKFSLERIDGSKGYEPDNVKWATMKEQQNNKCSNHLLVFQGKTLTVTMWAEELKINVSTMEGRIARGWTTEKALTTPVRKKAK